MPAKGRDFTKASATYSRGFSFWDNSNPLYHFCLIRPRNVNRLHELVATAIFMGFVYCFSAISNMVVTG